MFKQKGDSVVNWLGVDRMKVIEDIDKIVGRGGNLVEQSSQDGLSRWRLWRLQHAEYVFADAASPRLLRVNWLQGGNEVGEEADSIVVTFVQR